MGFVWLLWEGCHPKERWMLDVFTSFPAVILAHPGDWAKAAEADRCDVNPDCPEDVWHLPDDGSGLQLWAERWRVTDAVAAVRGDDRSHRLDRKYAAERREAIAQAVKA